MSRKINDLLGKFRHSYLG